MLSSRLLGGVAAVSLALVCASQAQAQQTDATLRGSIVDASGAPVSGATITILDTRTNAVSSARTSAQGNFAKTNLRVGGPYAVTVTAPGFEAAQVNIGSLTIGSNAPITLSLDGATRETIVVTATAGSGAIDIANGAGTVFSAEDIADTPTIDRDLTSILELDPLVSVSGSSGELGVISFGGIEPRLNGFVVDGALIGDKFKLEEAFYPTLRQPVSIDVLEAAAATFSEYSVLTTGAQGGLVNTVTKSGSNEFDGTLYYRFGDDRLTGNRPFGEKVFGNEFEETDYGLTVSGPIVKDKLFFVFNYEDFEANTPVIEDFSTAELAVFEQVRQAFLTATDAAGNLRYGGFDPGVKSNIASDTTTSERTFLKLDWLITDNHRASAWYLKAKDARLQNTDGLDFLFPTAFYDKTVDMDLYHGQLTSDWTDALSTTFRVIYKQQDTGQIPRTEVSGGATTFPTFVVEGTGLGNDVAAGPDPFRQANTFEDEQLQVFGSADYVMGNHILTFGGEYQDYELDNLFGQSCRGEYTFSSIADVLAGNAEVFYLNTPTNSCADRRAQWGYQKLDLFAQDEWQVTPDLSINYGVRYERYSTDDEVPPQGNFAAEYGANTSGDLDGLDVIQPRFGFDWNAPYETRVQGGVGLFSGGDPVVWFSNAYSPLASIGTGDVTDYADFLNVPAALQAQAAANAGPFNYDHIDPGFNIPSLWKASISADKLFDLPVLGPDWLLGVQVAYSQVQDSAAFINRAQIASEIVDPALSAQVAANTGVAPDGRPIYADARSTGDAIQLTNTDEGSSFSVSLAAEKEWDNGVSFYGAYTFTDSERLLPGSSSRHISNYRSLVTTDRNSAAPAGTSVFEVEDRFVFQTKFERDFIANLETQVVLKGVFESGPVSNAGYAYPSSNNRIFGRAAGGSPFSGVDQLYVPMLAPAGQGLFDDPKVIFANGADEAAVFSTLRDLGLLSDAGGVVEKNGLRGPWNQRFDLGFSQELPGIPGAEKWVGDNQLRLTVDIFNVANLLNDEWGTQYDDAQFDSLSPVSARLVTAATADAFRNGTLTNALSDNFLSTSAGGQLCKQATDCVYVYDTGFGGEPFQRDLEDSVFKIRVGLRYEF